MECDYGREASERIGREACDDLEAAECGLRVLMHSMSRIGVYDYRAAKFADQCSLSFADGEKMRGRYQIILFAEAI